MPEKSQETAANVGSAIFESAESFSEGFMDKVKAIHEHFDKDGDGYLNFQELSSLQLITSGAVMDGTQYGMVCQALGCRPSQGLSLDALKLTYASEGASAEDDYEKVFKRKHTKNAKSSDDDDIIEVGADGTFEVK